MTALARIDPDVAEYRLTVDDLWRMTDAGVFDHDDSEGRVELIEGRLVRMAPIGTEHFSAHGRLFRALVLFVEQTSLDPEILVGPPATLALNDETAPIPDVMVVRGPVLGRFVAAEQALLVVEVALSSLARDLADKQVLYARAGVPEYWVADVAARAVHVFLEPRVHGYAAREVFKGDDRLRPGFARGEALGPVKDLF